MDDLLTPEDAATDADNWDADEFDFNMHPDEAGGGTGGVGHIAVQLAKHFGADVYATISNENQKAVIESYGAIAINYKTEKVADYVEKHTDGNGFDIVYDSVGGENMTNSFEAAALSASQPLRMFVSGPVKRKPLWSSFLISKAAIIILFLVYIF